MENYIGFVGYVILEIFNKTNSMCRSCLHNEWNLGFKDSVYKSGIIESLSVDIIATDWNSLDIPTAHLLEIHPNIIHPSTPSSPQWSLSLWFYHQDPTHNLSSSIRATRPAHLILLDFITRTILGEQYKSFSSSLCNLLHSPVTSSLLAPNILLNTMFSNTLSKTNAHTEKNET